LNFCPYPEKTGPEIRADPGGYLNLGILTFFIKGTPNVLGPLVFKIFFSGPGGPPGSHPTLVEGSVSYNGQNIIKQKLFIGVTLVLIKKISGPGGPPGSHPTLVEGS
jgi:hypothetical protein